MKTTIYMCLLLLAAGCAIKRDDWGEYVRKPLDTGADHWWEKTRSKK